MYIEKHKFLNKIVALIFVQLLIMLANPLLIRIIDNQEIGFALLFFVNYLFGIAVIWEMTGTKINLLLLFYLTSGLFIGGRFFSVLLGGNLDLWSPTFFHYYKINDIRKFEIMNFVNMYFNALAIGSAIYGLRSLKLTNIHLSTKTIGGLNILLAILFIPIAYYVLTTKLKQFQLASSMGYAAIYLYTNQEGGGADFLFTLFLVLFGLSMAYGRKNIRICYMSFFVLTSLITIIIGARGMFGSVMLILLWMYNEHHKLSLKKIFFCIVIFIISILTIGTISLRNSGNPSDLNLPNLAQLFLYDQGGSLMVFDTSRLINDYPWQPYFQNFIPGFVRLYEFFTNSSLSTDATFAAHMCSNLNPQLYYNGYGLGWTLMSDFYLYSRGHLVIFGILTILFSYCCSIIVHNFDSNKLIKTIAYTTATSLLVLPRSGLNSTIPLIYYAIGVWTFFVGFVQLYNTILVKKDHKSEIN